jgi:hypothetical protein
MINAFLNFVGVVNRQLQKKHGHQFVSVSVTSTREKPLGYCHTKPSISVAFCSRETSGRR